jgi:broad specificity phosphatase PhoE
MEMLLVRHGEAQANSTENYNISFNCPDPELTDDGINQAQKLGERLEQWNIQKVYASDLRRAVQTAGIISEHIHVSVEICPELREINMGRLYLSTWESIEHEFPGYAARWHKHDSDLPYPEGENGAAVIHRSLPLIEKIIQSQQERVVIVTHGGTIRSLLCAFLNIAPEKRFLFGAPLQNCSITSVRWDARRHTYFIHSVNDSAHLD